MKASRAPGPVSYMQIHAKGKSNLDQNSKKTSSVKSSKSSGPSNEGNGGILKKFKDLDNIPDFSWGDANEMALAFDDNEQEFIEDRTNDYRRNNYSDNMRGNNNYADDEDDDITDDAHGWSSPRQQSTKATFYQTKSADAAVSPRSLQPKNHSEAPSSQFRSNYNSVNKDNSVKKTGVSFSQGPKTAPPKLNVTYDSDDDDIINSNAPDLFDTPPKKSQYSPKKSAMNNNSNNIKSPPPLPFQQQQQQQQQQKQDKASKVSISNKGSNNANNNVNIPRNSAQKTSITSSSNYQSQDTSLHISIANNRNSADNSNNAPPLPCEKPLNMPKQHSSPKSPSHLTDKDKLVYTKQPRHIDFKPYTLEQYKLIKPTQYTEIQGKLKPDLNTEELIAKRKNAERIKEFSKQLRHVNAELITQLPKRPSPIEQNDLQIARIKYESSRQRALEFAKQHIPKPTVVSEYSNNNNDNRNTRSRSAPMNQSNHSISKSLENNVGMLMDEDAFQAAKLQELEAKHQQSKAKMEAIKKSLHGF